MNTRDEAADDQESQSDEAFADLDLAPEDGEAVLGGFGCLPPSTPSPPPLPYPNI